MKPSAAHQSMPALRVDTAGATAVTETLVVEAPLQININNRAFTITMRTPGADAALVKGLLFTEGVVATEGLGYEYRAEPDPSNPVNTIVNVRIPEIYVCENLLEKRSLLSNASCGLCGKQDLDDIEITGRSRPPRAPLSLDRLRRMAERMAGHQETFHRTGGCHAAATFDVEGTLLTIHEDVGRHNAVDKVIGALIEEDRLDQAELIFVSGRISFEIVSKVCRAEIPFLAGVSAPSSLSIQMAERQGLTVLGFCRDDRATVYSHREHIADSG